MRAGIARWSLGALLVLGGVARADQRVGSGGDPLQIIFQSARAQAVNYVLTFDATYLPAETPAAVTTWLAEAGAQGQLGLHKLAADISLSEHLWIDGTEVEQDTCAFTTWDPNGPITFSFPICAQRLNTAGTSLAAELLIHEAIHHFGYHSSPEDERFATDVARALAASALRREGDNVDNWRLTPSADRPERRTDHVGVFTGDQVLVWGGCQGHRDVPHGCGSWLRSGSMLDLATNQWEAMNSEGAPSARSLASGLWTGDAGPLPRRMIIWGGCGQTGQQLKCDKALNDGAFFDPAANAWASMTVGPTTPSPRALHSAVWTGASMIVWGGIEHYKDPVLPRVPKNDGAIFVPGEDGGLWQKMNRAEGWAPSPRFGQTALWTTTGKMLVWGGCDAEAATGHCMSYLGDGGIYDPAADAWTKIEATGGSPEGRRGHVAVWTGTKMLIFGGDVDGEPLRDGGMFDPETGAWSEVNYGGPPGRTGAKATWAGDHLILFGGTGRDATGAQTFPSTPWEYHPHRGSDGLGLWRSLAPRDELQGRSGHTMIWTGSSAFVWGGHSQNDTFQWTGGTLVPKHE